MLLVPLGACSAAPIRTVVELPKEPRQPDGVVLDSEPGFPTGAPRAAAVGVVALKEPISDAVVRTAGESFFAAFTSHDPDAIDAILSHAARLLDAHGGSSFAVVRDELRRRVATFKAAGVRSVNIDSFERFDYDDLGDSSARPRPDEMRPGDVLARLRVTVPHTGGDRLFGDVVVLLFRKEESTDGPGQSRLRVVGFDEP
jgi:uncharacterized protein (DUF1684 family)